jgi:O-antigen/teichoic acid export membrane protein
LTPTFAAERDGTSSSTSRRPVPLSLRTNFSWTFAGNVLYAVSQWGFLILLAKLLNPTAVGEFAFALAVTAPIMIFANQGLTGLQATDAKGEFSFGEYFVCRFFTTTTAFVLIFFVSRILHLSEVVIVVGAAKAVEALCDIKYGQYQRMDRMDQTAKSMVLRGACSLLMASILVQFFHSVFGATLGLLVGNIAVLLFKDYRSHLTILRRQPVVVLLALKKTLQERLKMRRLLWQAFPLGLAAMFSSATSSIPRYFLEHYNGTATLGIFAALMYLLVAGRTLIVALAQACVAQLSRLYVERRGSSFTRLMVRQMLIGLAMGIGGIVISLLAGKPILRMIYRPEYAEYSHILVLVMIAAALNYQAEFSNGGLLAVRSIKIQPIILAICCGAILLLSVALIPRFGITGAALAVVITGAIQLSANLLFLRRAMLGSAVDTTNVISI